MVLGKGLFCHQSCSLYYIYGLLGDLRGKQLGCAIGGCWVGAMGYADDLILLAPNREVLQNMLNTCESYAEVADQILGSTITLYRCIWKYALEPQI